MKNKILILGDSNCVPRIENNIKYEDVFPYMFLNNYTVINRAKRGNTTFQQSEELNLTDDIKCFNVDYCIINLGFVDYVPRIFTKKENKILSILPSFLSKPIINIFSKNRRIITKFRKITYVDIKNFENNYQKIIDAVNKESKIILIKIIYPSDKLIDKSFGVLDNFKQYNFIIEKLAKKNNLQIFDPNLNKIQNKYLEDGIHFTKEMHEYFYTKLLGKLND